MAKKITDKVTWVGKIDWELKHFHGDELSTGKGSSYNSYLIRDKKTALIDTVWGPYDEEFVTHLCEEIDLHDINYIIMNHNESDHSGALPALMREIPDTPIYCTAKGEKILRGLYHQNWNYVNVKTGDALNIGDNTLTFIEAPMCHWPDTMVTYASNEQILFSNDVFGQHFATESLYDDTVSKSDLFYETEKYYANILNLYNPMVQKKIKEIVAMNLPLRMICPSHGIIWTNHIKDVIDCYLSWSNNYQENQITIIYDTMWQSTRRMAEAIADGIRQQDPTIKVKLMNAVKDDKNDIIVEVFRSRGILIGSPTVNMGITFAIAGIIEMIHGMKFKNKTFGAFGSSGWGGGAEKRIADRMTEAGWKQATEPFKLLWAPDRDGEKACREYGKLFAQKC
ncbi:oxygen-binding di-iron domain-containing protein [Segatella albensis]|jgi:flavorubredoxin|uniref:flavodoxin domain-containing protein n=1 Tax=Segatella albensis TaxID=77768 RepID=UPI00041E7276|nr:flavodoxin domain-containing protein [Segatella albensis]